MTEELQAKQCRMPERLGPSLSFGGKAQERYAAAGKPHDGTFFTDALQLSQITTAERRVRSSNMAFTPHHGTRQGQRERKQDKRKVSNVMN